MKNKTELQQPPIPEGALAHRMNDSAHAAREVEDVVRYLGQNGDPIDPSLRGERLKVAKLTKYLGFLANTDYVNDGTLTGDPESLNRQVEHNLVKAEAVGEGYFNLRIRAARERGYGDITYEDPASRLSLINNEREDQRGTLDQWFKYLSKDEAHYPIWFKQFVSSGLLRLGAYDKTKGAFATRSKGTTRNFPELNAEALSYVFDAVDASLRKQTLLGDKAKLEQLVKVPNFGKLYAYALETLGATKEHRIQETRGVWRVFERSDDPQDGIDLANSLRGHGTGWCTAGYKTAQSQLEHGDFHVYYTLDENGKATIPRIAVLMEYEMIKEVRGIDPVQAIEPALADKAGQYVVELYGGERFNLNVADMETMTSIDHKIKANPAAELTDDELIVLYEIDHSVEGFASYQDPRVEEIKKIRGDRDQEAIKRLVPEVIRRQLKAAYGGYATVGSKLAPQTKLFWQRNIVASPEKFEHAFQKIDKKWQDEGIYDHLVQEFLTNGTRFRLVATPNQTATGDQLQELVETFGGQRGSYIESRVLDILRTKNKSLLKKLSGTKGKEKVRFGLIPDKGDAAYKPPLRKAVYGKPDIVSAEDRSKALSETLSKQQSEQPNLHIRVPSLLDAITLWHTMKARGEPFNGAKWTSIPTFIEHFDLPLTEGTFPVSDVGYRDIPKLNRFYVGFVHPNPLLMIG